MYAYRFFPIAVLLATVACSDQAPTGLEPEPLTLPPSSAPTRETIVGYVVAQGDGSAVAFLRTATTMIPLHGAQATLLASVDSAEVSIVGTADAADGGFIVETFTVLSVRQRPVIDGVLIDSDGVLFVQQADGAMYALKRAPRTLQAHAGARIWVALVDSRLEFDFGVIEAVR